MPTADYIMDAGDSLHIPFYLVSLPFSLSLKYRVSIKHRPVNTYPLHGRAVFRIDFDDTAGAAADGASHLLLH